MTEYAVIGGGIIGMLTAFYLSESGAQVSIFDRSALGSESSWAGGGIISPLYPWRYPDELNMLASWGQQHYQSALQEIQNTSGIDPEYLQSGLLIASLDHNEIIMAENWCSQMEHHCKVISTADVGKYEEGIHVNPGTSGILLPDIAQVRNPRLMKALAQYLRLSGVEIHENSPIDRIREDDDGYILMSNGSEYKASSIVLAAGSWTRSLLRSLGIELDIRPVKGQMLLYDAFPDDLSHIILASERYLIPRKDGSILAGSTLEDVGFDKTTTDSARDELTQFAESILPVLKRRVLKKQWAGLRPALNDSIPVIGAIPGHSHLYINTGHYRNGVVTGLASAKLLSDIMLERQTILDASQYSYEAYCHRNNILRR